jgi:hypothetical protein
MFDETCNAFAVEARTAVFVAGFAGRRNVRTTGCHETARGEIDRSNCEARECLRQGHQEILQDSDARRRPRDLLLQAHEDKISLQCDYELGEVASSAQAALDGLKDAIIACKTEITGVCGKTVPGQGRMAACLSANKSTASKDCVDAISKIEAMAAQ